jgi:hypothetical protein
MYPKMKNLIISSIVIAVTSGLSLAQQDQNNAIILETLPKATKGFPVVLKVTIQGPQIVYNFSIYEYDIPITIYLTSKSDGKEYIIKSYSRREARGSSPGGVTIDLTDKVWPPLQIPTGQKYSTIFDIWSLHPKLWTDTCLSDVPSGKYSLSIELESEDVNAIREQMAALRARGVGFGAVIEKPKIKSNSIDLELIEPTEQEKKFIQKIQDLEKNLGEVNSKIKVSWVTVLRSSGIGISDNDISTLTQVSKDQISFHKLLADVNVSDEKARNKSIKDVNNAKLPKFFEPEQQLLLFELKDNPAGERENIIKKYPDLKGNMEKLKPGDKVLLRFHLQTDGTREPNKPAEPNKPNRQ